MLSAEKLKEICDEKQMNLEQLARHLVRAGLNQEKAISAIKNWKKGLYKPKPGKEDIRRLASALSVEENELSDWHSSYKYAPISARKARLVSQLINGRSVQDAMDLLKFTRKRAASMIDKVLKSAIADADEQHADVDSLFISCARIDDAGIRIGTKRWIPKDRGRAHALRKKACHIHITVTQL
ncbi:MAG: 50S ribosomal protein L22 [Sedimentisphaerales bacterium]|nr:50S ribosomal protein L22 [Sedimentisphaerales bacterium]